MFSFLYSETNDYLCIIDNQTISTLSSPMSGKPTCFHYDRRDITYLRACNYSKKTVSFV